MISLDRINMICEEYISRIFEVYSLVSVLSDKNGCKVLRLRHKTLNRDIVLRKLSKESEVYSLLSKYKCENLPEIFEVVSLKDGQIVLEEFIEGLTLAQVMESGRYRKSGVRKVLLGICNALDFLHGKGIVHRDIKPENIMVTKNGRVVLLDFNVSRVITPHRNDTEIMGTAGYASPELLGRAHSDARTDIYSLGVLICVMLTGAHPSEKLPRGKMGRVVRRCTAISPDERYQTVKVLAEAL